MGRYWMDGVKEKGELSVFNKSVAGTWAPVFQAAIDSFNKLAKRYGLGVKLKVVKDEESANIVMHVSSGTATFTYGDATEARGFDGKDFHGKTLAFGTKTTIEKAAIFLPSEPQTQAGFIRGKMVYEKANRDMMRVVAVHELVHACCLDDNNDHSKTNEGLFCDRLTPVGGKLVPYWSAGKGKPMPPMFIADETVVAIKSYWS